MGLLLSPCADEIFQNAEFNLDPKPQAGRAEIPLSTKRHSLFRNLSRVRPCSQRDRPAPVHASTTCTSFARSIPPPLGVVKATRRASENIFIAVSLLEIPRKKDIEKP
jgi:hypothetical protein